MDFDNSSAGLPDGESSYSAEQLNNMIDDDDILNQLEAVTDDLLLAMHDLRSVLVRKKADRLMKGDADD